VILLEIFIFCAKSLAECRAKSFTDVICKSLSCAILFGPIPFILVRSVNGLLGSEGGCGGFSSGFISGSLVDGTILNFLGRKEYPKDIKKMPNKMKTITNAAGSRGIPN
jgi:hypothetical protein